MKICERCSLPGTHEEVAECFEAQGKAMQDLLANCGDESACSGCKAKIYWMKHRRTGRPTPYTPSGLNHFIDCPKAQNFKRRSE